MRFFRYSIVAAFLTGFTFNATAPKPKAPSISAPSITVQGTTVTVTHTIRWTDDGRGKIDSVLTTETATGQAMQQQRRAQDAGASAVVSYVWTRPAIGQTISGTITAQLKRRLLLSGIASKAWSYTEQDVAPPTPTIDTVNVSQFGLTTRVINGLPSAKFLPVGAYDSATVTWPVLSSILGSLDNYRVAVPLGTADAGPVPAGSRGWRVTVDSCGWIGGLSTCVQDTTVLIRLP